MSLSSFRGIGAVSVLGIALICMGVIALGFVMPDRLFDDIVGVSAFVVATLLMIGCAILANLYDLKGVLHDELG